MTGLAVYLYAYISPSDDRLRLFHTKMECKTDLGTNTSQYVNSRLTIVREGACIGKGLQHVQHGHSIRELIEAVDVLTNSRK